MSKTRFLLYDSNDNFSNDIIEELKNNNLLSTFTLIDKKVTNINKLHNTLKECIMNYELPILLLPNISIPIEKNNIKSWIKTTQYFNIKTNNIKEKQQVITQPSPQDKLGIPKQEINKISDNYTFIDDKNTVKHFQNLNKESLILKDEDVTCQIVEDTQKSNKDQKLKILRMIRSNKK